MRKQQHADLLWETLNKTSPHDTLGLILFVSRETFNSAFDEWNARISKPTNIGQDVLIQESQSGINYWPTNDCVHRYIQGMCIDCGHLS